MSAHEAILLVDDDEAHLLIARRALQRETPGVEILVAHDGYEALRVLGLDRNGIDGHDGHDGHDAHRVAAVLMDLRMPGLSGWEILRRIRTTRRTAQIPVVIVSSSSRPDDVRRSYELGANSYLVKRFDAARPGGYLADAARYWVEMNEPPGAIAEP